MNIWLAVAAGGALGAVARFGLSRAVHAVTGTGFPWGTLIVNVGGCLAMGLFYVLLVERYSVGPELRAAIIVGLLGAFTTFSAFSMETLNLMERGAHAMAAVNVVGSVLLCLGGAWLGLFLGRQL